MVLEGSEFDETAAARLASLIKAVPGQEGGRGFVLGLYQTLNPKP